MDAPLWQQYLIYLGNLLHGDLGPSFTRRDFTVNDLFASGLPVSIMLGTLGLTLAAIIGTFLGTLAALKQNSAIDYFVVALATFGITTPNFVVAPPQSPVRRHSRMGSGGRLVVGQYNLLDIAGSDTCIAASRRHCAPRARRDHRSIARQSRAHRPRLWPAFARSCGRARLARRHAPCRLLSWPNRCSPSHGFGRGRDDFRHSGHRSLFRAGALSRDYTLVMGTVVVISVFVVVFNLIVDLLYAWLDPRVRYD